MLKSDLMHRQYNTQNIKKNYVIKQFACDLRNFIAKSVNIFKDISKSCDFYYNFLPWFTAKFHIT